MSLVRCALVGTVSMLMLAACGAAAPTAIPVEAPTISATPDPTPTPTRAPAHASPSSTPSDATTTAFPFHDEGVDIEPGTYLIPKSAWALRNFKVTFPEGWSAQYGHVYHGPSEKIGFYAVLPDEIFVDACVGGTDEPGGLQDVGPQVEELATALHQQTGPLASDPVETTLGGYPALRVDLSIPEGFDLSDCNVTDIGLQVWYSEPADKNLVVLRDQIVSVYIVDLDGERQVFLASRRATSEEDAQKLQEVLDSIQIQD